jgi:hypothetical protein
VLGTGAQTHNRLVRSQRFIPSGLAKEVFLDVYERLISFEPSVTDFNKRLFDAYAAEVARVDTNSDGVISAAEGEVQCLLRPAVTATTADGGLRIVA